MAGSEVHVIERNVTFASKVGIGETGGKRGDACLQKGGTARIALQRDSGVQGTRGSSTT
jgi:hypothetical protein